MQQFWYVAQHSRTGALACYLAHRTAPVDVDEIGTGLSDNVDAAQQRVFVAAEDLYAYGTLEVSEKHLAKTLLGIAHKGLGGDEFADKHVGTVTFAELPERQISDIVHRRQNQRELAQLYLAYFNHIQ